MNVVVESALKQLRAGEPQVHRNLTIYPLFGQDDQPPTYITLGEALAQELVEIQEVNSSGSVPHLLAINKANLPVLLIDGEELVGAKQNRVVNTSILLKVQSETTIPVSCTEHGRWSYNSQKFDDAESIMPHKVRRSKSSSVSQSLKTGKRHASDQGLVWEEISYQLLDAGVDSPTGAMQDVYQSKRDTIEEFMAALPGKNGQLGLMAALQGRIVGMDFVSRPTAYAKLHQRILKSHVMEAILEEKQEHAAGGATTIDRFESFIQAALQCRESSHPSVSLGMDLRFENGRVCGSALVHDETTIHAAFFSIDEESKDPGRKSRHGRRIMFTE